LEKNIAFRCKNPICADPFVGSKPVSIAAAESDTQRPRLLKRLIGSLA